MGPVKTYLHTLSEFHYERCLHVLRVGGFVELVAALDAERNEPEPEPEPEHRPDGTE